MALEELGKQENCNSEREQCQKDRSGVCVAGTVQQEQV